MSGLSSRGGLTKQLLAAQRFALEGCVHGKALFKAQEVRTTRPQQKRNLLQTPNPVRAVLSKAALDQQASHISLLMKDVTEAPERGLTALQSKKLSAQRDLRVPMMSCPVVPGKTPLEVLARIAQAGATRRPHQRRTAWEKAVATKRDRAKRRQ